MKYSTCSTPRRGPVFLPLTLSLLAFAITPLAANAGFLDKLKNVLGGETTSSADVSASLSSEEIGAGLKEALVVGTGKVVEQLGKTNGFNSDPAVHIPLPSSLESARSLLAKVGMSQSLDDLELRMNRAAELATPKAKALFGDAIREMTLDDVTGIYKGPDDAATRYFQSKMSVPLANDMLPIVQQSLADAGATQVYEQVVSRYNELPFVPPMGTDLSGYVVDEGMAGIFFYLAKEEAAIRQDPVNQTTELLKRVFGK